MLQPAALLYSALPEVARHQFHQHVNPDEAGYFQSIHGVLVGKVRSMHHRLFPGCRESNCTVPLWIQLRCQCWSWKSFPTFVCGQIFIQVPDRISANAGQWYMMWCAIWYVAVPRAAARLQGVYGELERLGTRHRLALRLAKDPRPLPALCWLADVFWMPEWSGWVRWFWEGEFRGGSVESGLAKSKIE